MTLSHSTTFTTQRREQTRVVAMNNARCSLSVLFSWLRRDNARSRSRLFTSVRNVPLTSRNCSTLFAAVRLGRFCKQGVVGSSPIVSTIVSTSDHRLHLRPSSPPIISRCHVPKWAGAMWQVLLSSVHPRLRSGTGDAGGVRALGHSKVILIPTPYSSHVRLRLGRAPRSCFAR